MKSYISNLSISNWGGGNPSGSFTFMFDGGNTTYTLTEEDSARIFAVALDIIERRKKEIAQALLEVETPTLLTGPVIDQDISF